MLESATANTSSYEPSSFETTGSIEGNEQLVEGYISSPEITHSARRFRSLKNQPFIMMAGMGLAVLLGLLLGAGTSFLFKRGGAPAVSKPTFKDMKLPDVKCAKDEVDIVNTINAAKKLAHSRYVNIRAGDSSKKYTFENAAAIIDQAGDNQDKLDKSLIELIKEQGVSKPAKVDEKASSKFEDLQSRYDENIKLIVVATSVRDWGVALESLAEKRVEALEALKPLLDAQTATQLQLVIDYLNNLDLENPKEITKEGDDSHKAILEKVKKEVDAAPGAKDEQKAMVASVLDSLELVYNEYKEHATMLTRLIASLEALKIPTSP